MPRPKFGAFYMSRTGKLGTLHDLSKYTLDYFGWRFGILKRWRDSGELLANPASKYCGSCAVRDYCWAVSGPKAHLVPQPWETAA